MIEVNCNLCGADDWRLRYPETTAAMTMPDVAAFRCTSPQYGSHAQIVECRRCGLVYANPQWSPEELVAAYTAVEDDLYLEERTGREMTFEKHMSALERFTGSANGRSLLDVGAYIGVFVDIARTHGWQAEGIEPSEWAVARARHDGIPVHQGTQFSAVLANRKYDVITMWDVIEHVPDPSGELQRAYQLLNNGGWLAVHTMDIGSFIARAMGSRWPWLMDMHLYYFSRVTLAAMLRKNGFDIIWSGAQGRYLRLGYIASRMGGLNQSLGHYASALLRQINLSELPVPLNFGDLFTIYARRPL
jgi:2-polyprenyl-3-methyl-5-hydroxy-6-metoxy-1,4-benzoquinol methylase